MSDLPQILLSDDSLTSPSDSPVHEDPPLDLGQKQGPRAQFSNNPDAKNRKKSYEKYRKEIRREEPDSKIELQPDSEAAKLLVSILVGLGLAMGTKYLFAYFFPNVVEEAAKAVITCPKCTAEIAATVL